MASEVIESTNPPDGAGRTVIQRETRSRRAVAALVAGDAESELGVEDTAGAELCVTGTDSAPGDGPPSGDLLQAAAAISERQSEREEPTQSREARKMRITYQKSSATEAKSWRAAPT